MDHNNLTWKLIHSLEGDVDHVQYFADVGLSCSSQPQHQVRNTSQNVYLYFPIEPFMD